MRNKRTAAAAMLRTGRAAILKLRLAFRHRSIDESLRAAIALFGAAAWWLCLAASAACIVAGFCHRPYCFATAFFYAVLTRLIRASFAEKPQRHA